MQHDSVAHAELVRLILRAREHPGGEVYAGDVQAALCQRQRVATGAAAKIKDAAHGRSGLSEEGFEEVAFRRVILIAVEAVILVGVVLGEGRHGLREIGENISEVLTNVSELALGERGAARQVECSVCSLISAWAGIQAR